MKAIWGMVLACLFCTANAEMYGTWNLVHEVDRITDEENWAIVGPGLDMQYLPAGAALVHCDDSHIGVGFGFAGGGTLGSASTYLVTCRLDQEPPVSNPWSSTTTGTEFIVTGSGDVALALFSAMLGGEELALRVQGDRGSETYLLPLSGFRESFVGMGCYRGPAL